MPKLWEKTANAKDSSDLKEVDLSTLKIDRPSIIIIAGWPDTDKSPNALSKEIYALRRTLAEYMEPEALPKLYCFSHKNPLSAIFNIIPYNFSNKRRFDPAAENLARGAILPLVSKDGQPLPFEEAQKNLRNLTFYNMCAGSVVVQKVYNASLKLMQDVGFKQEDAQNLLHEVANIAMATVTSPKKEKDRFATLSLINNDDLVVRFFHPLRSLFNRVGKALKIRSLSDTSALVTAGARRSLWDLRRRHEVMEGVRLKRFRFLIEGGGGFPVNFNHEVADYSNNKDTTSPFARIVPTAFVNAVRRTETLNAVQLLNPLAGAPEQYRKKIATALAPGH